MKLKDNVVEARLITQADNLYSIKINSHHLVNKVSSRVIQLPYLTIMSDLVERLNTWHKTRQAQLDYEKMPMEYTLVRMADDMFQDLLWPSANELFKELLYEDKLFTISKDMVASDPTFSNLTLWINSLNLNEIDNLNSPELGTKLLAQFNSLSIAQKAGFMFLWHNTSYSTLLSLLVIQKKCSISQYVDGVFKSNGLEEKVLADNMLNTKLFNATNDIISWIDRIL